MKIIKFCKHGEAISDFYVSEFVDDMFNVKYTTFNVSTFTVIDEIRARVKEGKINLEDVEIYVEDNDGNIALWPMDKDGRCSWWPESTCLFEYTHMRLL